MKEKEFYIKRIQSLLWDMDSVTIKAVANVLQRMKKTEVSGHDKKADHRNARSDR